MSSPRPMTRTLPPFALALLLAAPALAADELPRTGAAPIEVRAVAPAPAEARRAPRTAEEKALEDAREATALRVKEVLASMAGVPDGPALRALQLKVVELKREGQLEFLRTKARFARQRGDLAAAQDLDARILAITHPPSRGPAALASRPAPGAPSVEGVRP